MKEFGSEKIYVYASKKKVYALMVPSLADELLPQLLMEQFDTLPIQYRHIEDMHEGVWLKKKIDKMTAMRT